MLINGTAEPVPAAHHQHVGTPVTATRVSSALETHAQAVQQQFAREIGDSSFKQSRSMSEVLRTQPELKTIIMSMRPARSCSTSEQARNEARAAVHLRIKHAQQPLVAAR